VACIEVGTAGRRQPGVLQRMVWSLPRLAMVLRFALVTMLAAGVLAAATAQPAEANRKYASIVIDAKTGTVYYARSADSRRYPASLTKVMTLYMLFDALERGEVTMDTKMTVSKRAAGQAPSKLRLKAGSTIMVKDAIGALVVKSANDVATVVGEHLAGTEWEFAKTMTRVARTKLGMTSTRFYNASGLPHRHKRTTARDMAQLGRAIYEDFPQYRHFFKMDKFRWNGRTYTSHNNLLGKYKGADGIKTGYTRASGFNLISSVDRGDTHLIAVVLGGRTARRRDKDMERILDLTFRRLKKDPHFMSRVFAATPTPKVKPSALAAPTITLAEATPTPKPGRAAVETALDDGAQTSETKPETAAAPALSPNATPAQIAALQEPVVEDGDMLAMRRSLVAGSAVGVPGREGIMTTVARLSRSAGAPSPDVGLLSADEIAQGDVEIGVGIQIGAFSKPATADEQLRQAVRLSGGVLSWGHAAIIPVQTSGGTLYRARFGPLSADQAAEACASLGAQGVDCLQVDDTDWDKVVRR